MAQINKAKFKEYVQRRESAPKIDKVELEIDAAQKAYQKCK